MTKEREALIKIATVNAMDYEYQAWARQALANNALEKMAENAKELGLDYEPNKNEFKPDWDEKLALTEEVIRLSKRIEELEAQPEPEYLAFMDTPQRKPLTDDEIILIVAECASSHQHTDIHFARAIEAAHGIKGEA